MKKYNVTGMSCAACVARVEKAVKAVPGVESCSVNLLTKAMRVEGPAKDEEIVKAVEAAGYGAAPKEGGAKLPSDGGNAKPKDGRNASEQEGADAPEDAETRALFRRFKVSLVLLLPLLWMSTGAMNGLPVPEILEGNPVGLGIVQLLLALPLMLLHSKFFTNGFKGAVHMAPNMDTLVALGSGTSFVWSLCVLLSMSSLQAKGETARALEGMQGLYFESAAMILVLVGLGKTLEARSKGKTASALRSLISLSPKKALVEREGKEVLVDAAEVLPGETFLVRGGESVPVDGTVLEGSGAIDESALTGESLPVDKGPGDEVLAATLNRSGLLRCRATRVGSATALAKVIELVEEASSTKAPISRLADKVAAVFVPCVLGLGATACCFWLFAGAGADFALARGISVLVVSCPCALGLATPVAIMVAAGLGARNGILFKDAASIESAGRIDIVALDKTGTLTKGAPCVKEVIAADGCTAGEVLGVALALEAQSLHPLAKSVCAHANALGTAAFAATELAEEPGMGVTGKDGQGRAIFCGRESLAARFATPGQILKERAAALESDGCSLLFVGREGLVTGLIALADPLREESVQCVSELKAMGIRTCLLTGDNLATAKAVAKEAGVEEVHAGLLPHEKDEAIRSLKKEGRVLMAGDGINDAAALTRADLGVAMGGGTDVAAEAAGAVLMKGSLSDLPALLRLGRTTIRNIRQNLFWAFGYNIIGIPLAAGLFLPLGWKLSPVFAATAMSLSSFLVVTNALRLNFAKLYKDAPRKKDAGQGADASPNAEAKTISQTPPTKETNMSTTIKIKGMMCPHCEAHMKEALEKIDGVTSAVTSHTACNAVVECSKEVSEQAFKDAVKAAGYEYLGLEK